MYKHTLISVDNYTNMISWRSKITRKVLSYFLLNPDSELYLNEIARKFEVDRGNLVKKLREWSEEGLLIKNTRGNLSLYKINRDYPFYKELNKIVQKSFGLEYELKKVLEKIVGLESAIIFGSYARDAMETESDIDVLLVGRHKFLDAQGLINGLEKKYEREISVIDMSVEEFNKKKKEDFLKNVFNNDYIKIV